MTDAALERGHFEARILIDLNGVERGVAGVRQSVDCWAKPKKKVGNPALSG
jgi:hypothetical protein